MSIIDDALNKARKERDKNALEAQQSGQQGESLPQEQEQPMSQGPKAPVSQEPKEPVSQEPKKPVSQEPREPVPQPQAQKQPAPLKPLPKQEPYGLIKPEIEEPSDTNKSSSVYMVTGVALILISCLAFVTWRFLPQIRQALPMSKNKANAAAQSRSAVQSPMQATPESLPADIDEAAVPPESPASGVSDQQPPANKRPSIMTSSSSYSLSGIVMDDTAPMAIINNNVYQKGDTVGNAKVIDISKDMVTLQEGDRTIALTVK